LPQFNDLTLRRQHCLTNGERARAASSAVIEVTNPAHGSVVGIT